MHRSLAVALSLFSTACMYSPHDGQHLATPFETVHFEGYGDAPNELVSIQVQRPINSPCNDVELHGLPLCVQQHEWVTIAQVRTSSSSTQLFDDNNQRWYGWTADLAFPASLWRHESATRMYMVTRALVGSDQGYTVGPDYAECYAAHHASAWDWREHCSVGQDARITTPAP